MPNDDPPATAAELETRLAELRTARLAAQETAETANAQARLALVRNDDADGAIHDRMQAVSRLEAIEGALKDLEALIPATKEAEATASATKRMVGIHRGYSSLLDQRAKDLERIIEAAATLGDAVNRLNGRHNDLSNLLVEALILAERFGVEVPDLHRPQRPAAEPRVVAALSQVRSLTLTNEPAPPDDLRDLPMRSTIGHWSIRRAFERIADTPTAKLLAFAGAGLFGDPEAWETQRREAHDRARDEADAARQGERDRYDNWLRSHLGDALPKEAVERAAIEAGLCLRSGRAKVPGASLHEAADRLGIVGLTEQHDGPIWWSLPRRWDQDRFRLLPTSRMSIAGVRG